MVENAQSRPQRAITAIARDTLSPTKTFTMEESKYNIQQDGWQLEGRTPVAEEGEWCFMSGVQQLASAWPTNMSRERLFVGLS